MPSMSSVGLTLTQGLSGSSQAGSNGPPLGVPGQHIPTVATAEPPLVSGQDTHTPGLNRFRLRMFVYILLTVATAEPLCVSVQDIPTMTQGLHRFSMFVNAY